MKKRQFFYSIVSLAFIVLIAGIISYATESRPPQTDLSPSPVEQTTSSVPSTETAPAVKKKACGCCADRIARLQAQIRRARERRQAAQHASVNVETSQQQPSRASASP